MRSLVLSAALALSTMPLVAQDINMDGHVDCDDSQLLGNAITAGSNDARFDLDGNGTVELADHAVWRDHLDPPWVFEDVTLDRRVDQRDILVYSLNTWTNHNYGICRGDINLDGYVGEFDYDLFRYYDQNEVDIPSAPIRQHEVTDVLSVWNGTAAAVIAESSHVQLLAVPQVAPPGFLSAKLVVRTRNVSDVLSTFHGLHLSGDVHQASSDSVFFSGPYIWGGGVGQFGNPELARVDTHLLLRERDRSFGNGQSHPFEFHDASNPVDLAMPAVIGVVPEIEAVFGLGELRQESAISVFAIRPDSQGNEIALAQIVTPAVMPGTGEPGQVFVRLGVMGGTAEREPFDDYPVFGQEEPISFPLFAAPCDFDTDGACDVADLVQLENVVGTNDVQFDLDQSGGVDHADVRSWFRWFTQQNGEALPGDADLDGDVDANDLNRLGIHWLMPNAGWSGGDFNADGIADAADLNGLGLNWQRGVASPMAVPEPDFPLAILLVCGLLAAPYSRRFERVGKKRIQTIFLLWLAVCCVHHQRVIAQEQPLASQQQLHEDGTSGISLPAIWEYSRPLLSPEKRTQDPSRAQKDPSVVFYDGRWHVFMTVKLPERSAIEYCSFESWEDADKAQRTILKVSDSNYYCAPQVFYFAPHKRWYLVYQMGVPDVKKMWVAYSTTDDIADPDSWTPANAILDGGSQDPRQVGGLDYWIICDEQRAYLFLTSLNGKMWRLWTDLDDFPQGFDHCKIALEARVFEASHTYRLKGLNKYLTIIEENGRRYYKAYVANRLDGPWTPLADSAEKPFAGWHNIRPATGVQCWTDNISHGELIRDGYDQTLTVDPANLQFIFQGMLDADKTDKGYGQFQWRIGMLTPVIP